MLRTLHIGCCAMVLLTLGCTESFRPDVSTETGNPPIIDSDKVALVVTSDEVHVVGEPGAVTPPEGQIEVTILRNQEVARGPVESDGSFDVEVDATLDDVFEVRAVNGEGARSLALIVIRGGAQVGEGDGGVLSCEQRSSFAYDTVTQAIASADRSCATDDDCMLAYPDSACFAGCGFEYVSAQGSASIEAVREALDDGFCADFEDGCDRIIPPCVPPEPAMCVGGQCEAGGGGMIVDGGVCSECVSSELTWRALGPGILPAEIDPSSHTLRDCVRLELTTLAGEQCEATVPQCEAPAGAATVAALVTLLDDENVMQAFAAGGTTGYPEDMAGIYYELTLGDATFVYRSCAGGGAGVLCEPSALEDLVHLLNQLESENRCELGATHCTAEFEIGDCDAAIPVWWHDPATGVCMPRTYGGCGGNDNRYESQAACEEACVLGGECPPNRVTIDDVCLACGPAGGCADTGTYCALLCTIDADCENEKNPWDGGPMECDEAQGLCVGNAVCL